MNWIYFLLPTCISSFTIVLSMGAGTVSHISPYFEPLKLIASRNHTIYFATSSQQLSFVKDYSFFKLYDLGSCDFNKELDDKQHGIRNGITARDLPPLKHMTLNCYGHYVEKYRQLVDSVSPDLMLCDFFADACMDVAISMNVKLAVAGMLGILGFGSDWFIPPFFSPHRIQDWIQNPLNRITSFMDFVLHFPSLFMVAQRHKKLQRESGIGYVPVDRRKLFSSHLYLCHTLFGFYPPRYLNYNQSECIDTFYRSLPPNVIPFGPIIKEEEKKDSHLNQLLDDYSQKEINVIYIAFGSKAGAAKELIQSICDTISVTLQKQDNVAFIWANRNTDSCIQELHESSWKVNTLNWVNQKQVLSHSAVKIFFTHGGISSIQESLYYGKPLLVYPFFGDQFYNAKVVEDAGIGLELSRNMNSHELYSTFIHFINQLTIKDSLLSLNLQKIQKIAKYNSRMHLQTVANMIEMAADVGVDHLVPLKPSFYSRYSLLITISIGFSMIYVVMYGLQWIKVTNKN